MKRTAVFLSVLVLAGAVLTCSKDELGPMEAIYDPASPAYVPAPAASENVTVVPGPMRNDISWNSVSGADSYGVYWTDDGSDPSRTSGSRIESVSGPYAHTELQNETEYRYVVVAVRSTREGEASAVVSGTPFIAAPADVTVTAGYEENLVSWEAVPGATGYVILWTDDGGYPSASGANRIATLAIPYVHSGLTNGTIYQYVLLAVVGGEEGRESPVAWGTPDLYPPAGVVVTAGIGRNTVSWSPVGGVDGYSIYWSTNGTNPTKATGTKIAGAASPYVHSGLVNGKQYRYVVVSVHATQESVESSVASGTPTIPVPTGVVATAGIGQNTVSWSPVGGVDGYSIYWSTNGTNPTKATGTKIAGAASPYVHAGLTNWKRREYRYVVVAVWQIQEGGESAVASGTPSVPPLSGVQFVWIPAGSFPMGSTAGGSDETPVHGVQITGFWMSKYEITQSQFQGVTGSNPSYFSGANRPVEQVTWHEATNFCRRLSSTHGVTVRLPTEAEWEYACRAGTTTEYNTGTTLSTSQANFNSSATVNVGSYAPNAWGLYDMHGNVWEWCQDWYSSSYYSTSPATDPPGPVSGTYRVLRGGGWFDGADGCRSAARGIGSPDGSNYIGGFRVVVRPGG